MMHNDAQRQNVTFGKKQYNHDFYTRLLISASRPSKKEKRQSTRACKEQELIHPFFSFF
jgi:hypothetical protein